jgi:hypothetical protein
MPARKNTAPQPDFNALALAAGLTKAVEKFPQDIEMAAQAAMSARKAAGELNLVAAEPWPPMRVKGIA